MPLTVVFDTNILFSATGWRGNPFQCVELARSGQIAAVSCEEILKDLAEKLAVKLAFSPSRIDDTLADYLSFHSLVSIPGTLDAVPRDPEDNAVLECALECEAQFIITGDLDLLSLGNFRGIEIVRAAEFLQRWRAGEIRGRAGG
ncbi:MAG: putative toxin-antitoxin system toxin component, PIN family [Verrucomicrobia bacterium]|nr:putative toxin-antitoxin system toxin component, PIN family [Verrucomicrobiota bacterium]